MRRVPCDHHHPPSWADGCGTTLGAVVTPPFLGDYLAHAIEGNSNKTRLLDFIEPIEQCLSRPAIRNYLPIQPGGVPTTWADTSLLEQLTKYQPRADLHEGIWRFVDWNVVCCPSQIESSATVQKQSTWLT